MLYLDKGQNERVKEMGWIAEIFEAHEQVTVVNMVTIILYTEIA